MKKIQNDLELTEHCLKVRRAAGRLDELVREGNTSELWKTLEVIYFGASAAQFRINALFRETKNARDELVSRSKR